MSQWNTPISLLREELQQLRDEGVVIPDSCAPAWRPSIRRAMPGMSQ